MSRLSQATGTLSGPEETCLLARRIAPHLKPGDVICLDGPIGAGKTHFARCLIQSLLRIPEDVPSPTFTLVQTYDSIKGEIWHADLYRLTRIDEVEELGLLEAFDTAVCLVEWPDRLGRETPETALMLTFATGESDDARSLTASWRTPRWNNIRDIMRT